METSCAIVKLETRPHRTVAQENWGLTADQMVGMEVHHRVPRSEGGTNDPSNLFVCSPSMHRWGWHSGEAFVGWGAKASEGRDPVEHSETSRRAALLTVELRLGVHAMSPEKQRESASKGGSIGGKLPWWHNPETGKTTRAKKCPGEGWVRGRNPELVEKVKVHLKPGNSGGGTSAQHSTQWRCLVTGKVSTPCGLSAWQRARGIDKKLRERVT
jgi:hypothetical protein